MRKKKFNYLYIFFLLFFLCISIGYAVMSKNLNITGNSEVKSNNWDIHFENVVVKEGSVTATKIPTIDVEKDGVDFSVSLNLPGDFYEFTVDVVNSGTIDGMIDSVTKIPELTDTQKKYLNYIIEYENGEQIVQKQLVPKEFFVRLKVRVEYKSDIDENDLPTSNDNLNLGFTLNYIQGDDTGISVKNLGVKPDIYFGEPYITEIDGSFYDFKFYEDGSVEVLQGEEVFQSFPEGTFIYTKDSIFMSGEAEPVGMVELNGAMLALDIYGTTYTMIVNVENALQFGKKYTNITSLIFYEDGSFQKYINGELNDEGFEGTYSYSNNYLLGNGNMSFEVQNDGKTLFYDSDNTFHYRDGFDNGQSGPIKNEFGFYFKEYYTSKTTLILYEDGSFIDFFNDYDPSDDYEQGRTEPGMLYYEGNKIFLSGMDDPAGFAFPGGMVFLFFGLLQLE